MGSNSKLRKPCIEDRLSGFPDEVLCHILSFLPTKDAVKTSVLSHRWGDVWTNVPNIDLALTSRSEFDRFAVFVDRVLVYRSSSKIHGFKLRCRGFKDDFSRIDSWIRTVVRRNVVELELDLFVDLTPNTYQGYPLPRRLLMCNTLVVLKLTLHGNDVTATPSSGCFPSLKFLHVTVRYPEGDSMEKLFSCCPVLEDLIIEGVLEEDSVLNFIISGPKLRRLRISLNIDPFPFDGDEDYKMLDYKYKVLINANAPYLEELDVRENFLASYSLSRAKLLTKAKIDLGDLHAMEDLKFIYESAGRIQGLFAGIINVTSLSLSAPLFGDHYIQTRYNLPTFYNLNNLELHLQTCCSWQYLIKLLQISPNLEYLVFENNIKCSLEQCEGELVHEWCPPKIVPICLWSRLKTICIRGFQGRPDEMEVTKYLLKHGRFLNMMKICISDFSAEKELKVRQELAKFRRASRTCQVEFPKLNV